MYAHYIHILPASALGAFGTESVQQLLFADWTTMSSYALFRLQMPGILAFPG